MHTMNVLLIDADDSFSASLKTDPKDMDDLRITRKVTLAGGLEELGSASFDAVVLSLSLPDASVTESVTKTAKIARGVPLIGLAEKGDTPKALESLRLGTNDYVVKGCRCDALTRTVRHAMERNRLIAEKEHARNEATTAKPQWTSQLSHDLRNSLANIQQFGNILLDGLAGELSAEQREYLGIMVESSGNIRKALDALDGPADSHEKSSTKLKCLTTLEK